SWLERGDEVTSRPHDLPTLRQEVLKYRELAVQLAKNTRDTLYAPMIRVGPWNLFARLSYRCSVLPVCPQIECSSVNAKLVEQAEACATLVSSLAYLLSLSAHSLAGPVITAY